MQGGRLAYFDWSRSMNECRPGQPEHSTACGGHVLNMMINCPSGRIVHLDRLFILPTQTDWTDPNNPVTMDNRIPSLVSDVISKDSPPFVLKRPRPGSNLLPPVTCIASFRSDPLEPRDVSVQFSWLVICWFTETVDQSVHQLVREGLDGVDWESNARDCFSEW